MSFLFKIHFFSFQSESMKNLIRENYGTPLLIISHRSLNIEKPAEIANKIADDALQRKLDAGIDNLTKIVDNNQMTTTVHKHRKAKGPNPLSCKKKKKIKRLFNNK